MSQNERSEVKGDKPSVEQCLFIGIPALIALIFLSAEVGWAIAGQPSAFAPTRWLDHSMTLFAYILLSVFGLLVAGAVLWGMGLMASMLGGVVIKAYRRWCHR